jgi:hypothetical protein
MAQDMMTGSLLRALLTVAVTVQQSVELRSRAAAPWCGVGESRAMPQPATSQIPGTPPPPPPVKPDEDLAKEQIVEVLEHYRKAHEGRDFPGLQRVYPTAPGAWRNQMAQYVRLEITSDAPRFEQLDMSMATAVVEVAWTRTGVHKYTGREQRKQTHTIYLDRRTFDNRWVIARVTIR